MSDNNQTTVFTMGYEGYNINSFIEQVVNTGIDLVVDVREIPISRKKGFSKTALNNHLANNDIKYIHFKKLGSPKELRHKVKEDKDFNSFSKEYKKVLKTRLNEITQLTELVLKYKSCLLCYEKDALYCHRSIISNELINRNESNLQIKHI